MIDDHMAFGRGLDYVHRFLTQTTSSGCVPGAPLPVDAMMDHVSMALEDIPADARGSVRMVAMRPVQDVSLRQSISDVAANLAGMAWGDFETFTDQLRCVHLLASLALQHYTYQVDAKLIRGARPTPDKLAALARCGCTTTINLCEEMPDGDAELIGQAGCPQMIAVHIPITDCTAPTLGDVEQFIAAVDAAAGRVYVYCEAGVGRTGVMVACYRMHHGWDVGDTTQEARNFRCSIPDQIAFIQQYSASPVTSESATPQQLMQTVALNVDPAGLQRVTELK